MDKSILGKRVKDKITGFEGIAVAITHWLNGCTRVSIQPRKLNDKDGAPIKEDWFDSEQVTVLKGGLREEKKAPTGGPQRDPDRGF